MAEKGLRGMSLAQLEDEIKVANRARDKAQEALANAEWYRHRVIDARNEAHHFERTHGSITVAEDGKTYGTWPVMLVKGIEVLMGKRQGRYGGIAGRLDGEYVEQRDGWWTAKGYTIVEPEIPATVTA